MSALAWFLFAILTITFLSLVVVRRIETLGDESLLRRFLAAYPWLIFFVLGYAVWYFIGFDRNQTPRLPVERQLRIEGRGYYVAANDDGEFTFANDAEQNAFQHNALAKGERITLKPVWNHTTQKANQWLLRFDVRNDPLRLDGRCVNLPQDRWLASNESITIYLTKGSAKRFVSIRWQEAQNWLRKISNKYYFSQGRIASSGEAVYEFKDVLMSESVLDEGRSLATMARLSSDAFKRIAPNIDENWWDIFQGVTWVREKTGQRDSRIGFLISDDLFSNPDLAFYKESTHLDLVKKEEQETFSADVKVSYGLGYKNSLSLNVSRDAVQDPQLGILTEVRFSEPQSWPLPPPSEKPFIITSSKDYIPLDGFWFDLGNTTHPFYAKAHLTDDGNAIEINDGKKSSSIRFDETLRLGDYSQGVLLSMTQLHPSASYAGRWAVAFLLAATFLVSLLILKEREVRIRLDWAWNAIWGLMLTILVLRLVLAYRVSLFPPSDASPRQIENVFHKSLSISLWLALGVIPLIYLLTRFLTRPEMIDVIVNNRLTGAIRSGAQRLVSRGRPRGRKRQSKPRDLSTRIFVAIWIISILWIVGGKVYGHTESFLGLRINIGSHLLILSGLAVITRRILVYDLNIDKIMALAFIISIPVLMIVIVRDNGFVIYFFSFAIYAALMALWNRYMARTGAIVSIALVIITALAGFSAPLLIKMDLLNKVTHPLVPENVFYRIVSFTETEDSILLAQSDDSHLSMDLFLRNAYQNWQMLLYVAEGAKEPKGYCRAPLSDRGMTYPTSMADCVFSTYVVSEHGKWAGFLMVLIYVAIGFVCFYAAAHFPAGDEYRGLILILVGGFFAVNALYTASANVGLVPFTGQNIPLLALYSESDLLQCAILFALISFLLHSNLFAGTEEMFEDQTAVRVAATVFLIFLLISSLFVLIRMGQLAGNPYYARDLNLSADVFDALKNNLPDPENKDKATAWKLTGERLIKQPGPKSPEIVRQLIDQFNGRAGKFDARSGVIYLNSRDDGNIVRINSSFFKMRSPFRTDSLWAGRITGRSQIDEPCVSALGHPFRISLAESGLAKTIPLSDTSDIHASRVAALTEDKRPDSSIFCDLIRDGNNLLLEPRKGTWKVYVEGRRIESRIQLNPFDIVIIEKPNNYRRNLMYLGVQAPILAFVQWRNGQEQRIFLKGDTFPLVFALGEAGDRAKALGKELPDMLPLTIDLSLQKDLNREITAYAGRNPAYKDSGSLDSKRLAVTVLDAFSGDLLALPSWPFADPNGVNMAEAIRGATPDIQTRLLANYNFTNHVVGSTIKPIVFATVASQLWPEIDLADLSVFNRADASEPGAVHLHKSLGGISIEPWDCHSTVSNIDSHSFIIRSLDYYEGVVGMIGTLLSKQEWQKVFPTGGSKPDVQYKGHPYQFDLRKVPDSPFTLLDPLPRPLTVMDNTLLFKGLPQLFQLHISATDSRELQAEACTGFLPIFAVGQHNEYFDIVLPEPINFRPRDFQSVRKNFVTFLLGAGPGRLNNIAMAEAAARLATGRRIVARLQRTTSSVSDKEPSEEGMPQPVSITTWRNSNLIAPMRQAAEVGTASALKGLVGRPYALICKTGTIEERENGLESETLLFVIGEWQSDHFIPGRTLACFFYMQESKRIEGEMAKFDFAKPIIALVLKYLKDL